MTMTIGDLICKGNTIAYTMDAWAKANAWEGEKEGDTWACLDAQWGEVCRELRERGLADDAIVELLYCPDDGIWSEPERWDVEGYVWDSEAMKVIPMPVNMTWQDHHTTAELVEYQRNYGKALADLIPCHGCGTPTPVVLLDGKAPKGSNPETADFTVLYCRPCYGPGWCPT